MRKALTIFAVVVAVFWVSLNLTWVQVGEKGFTGAELSPTLNLVPGIVLIMIFIALYKKLARTLTLLASAALLAGSYAILSTGWISNGSVIAELERLTGVLGGDHTQLGIEVTQSVFPVLSGAIGIIAAVAGGFVIFSSRSVSKKIAPKSKEPEDLDSRSLWEQTDN